MKDVYTTPLCGRYAGEKMQRLFSQDTKFSTWRKLWVALAEAEQELGIPITDAQLDELRSHIFDINYEDAEERERIVRHDVMSHVYAYGLQCPTAAGIIHLGATSCYVGDNTDIIIFRDALKLIRARLVSTVSALSDFAYRNRSVVTLAYTHFQAAQPTTFGKRATLWIQDLLIDIEQLDALIGSMRLLGCKGTTGTAASFYELFDGDYGKVTELERLICEKTGFAASYAVSGQTYTRKLDSMILSVLSGIAQSAAKFSNDTRLLSHLKEFDEPFEAGQIGSSAMAYKRNPMRSERIASLCRYIICDAQNPAFTAAGQWLERTLDDSANRRISLPEAFLATDAVLRLYENVVSGGTVYPMMAKRHFDEEAPFMATETILMYCVKHKGADRQQLHEAIRVHSVDAAKQIKLNGAENDLIDRILSDSRFGLTRDELDMILTPEKFTGFAVRQTEDYLQICVRPFLDKNNDSEDDESQINV